MDTLPREATLAEIVFASLVNRRPLITRDKLLGSELFPFKTRAFFLKGPMHNKANRMLKRNKTKIIN